MWLPQNALWQGTIFEAALTSAISTDLPGDCTAVVTKNVYSSLDGHLMLIPQGSILFGAYNSSISYAQSRVQVGWYALIRPDGLQITLGNMSATDAHGKAGLKGIINDHPFQYLKALGLITAMNVAVGEFRGTAQQSANPYIQQLMADSVNITTRFGEKLIDRALDVQPTITVKAGTKINVVTNMNLFIPPLAPYQVNEPYTR